MSCRSVLNRVRRPLAGAAATGALLLGAFAAAAPAQAAPSAPVPGADANVLTVSAAPVSDGPSTRALCSTPTRLTTQAIWECTVFSGQFIQAWINCSGTVYYSPLIGEGSWYIIGTCPPGTVRITEGINEI
jgi:hypothetical protein